MRHYKPELTDEEERLREKIQDDIHFCLNCQARDSGEWIWVMGDEYELEDLFYDYEVKEESKDRIVKHLFCPNCGTELSRGDRIGLEDKYDKEIKKHLKEAEAKYGKHIEQLSKGIKQFPTLALNFPLAKNILKEIKNNELPVCSVQGDFYRARKIMNSKVFELKDFLAPPLGKSEEGRFNHAGQSHFYISEEKSTAIAECIPTENEPSLVWLQEFKLDKIEKILDLSYKWHDLGPSTSTLLVALHQTSVLQQTKSNKEKWRPDYYLTRFIMDCAKKCGFSGIKYSSVKSTMDYNVVLFSCNKDWIINYEKPEVIIYNPKSDEELFEELFQFENFLK